MAKTETPLLKFLRALGTTENKESFAAECGTTLVYLYQLAASDSPNPRLRLAMAIRDSSAKWARKLRTPSLTFDDLIVGAEEV